MCNLSQGVKEQGIHQGIEIGTERGRTLEKNAMILKMLQKQCPIQIIMDFTDYPLEKIQKLAEEHHISIVYNA